MLTVLSTFCTKYAKIDTKISIKFDTKNGVKISKLILFFSKHLLFLQIFYFWSKSRFLFAFCTYFLYYLRTNSFEANYFSLFLKINFFGPVLKRLIYSTTKWTLFNKKWFKCFSNCSDVLITNYKSGKSIFFEIFYKKKGKRISEKKRTRVVLLPLGCIKFRKIIQNVHHYCILMIKFRFLFFCWKFLSFYILCFCFEIQVRVPLFYQKIQEKCFSKDTFRT